MEPLHPSQLRWVCPLEDVGPQEGEVPFIGQDRAQKALVFGLSMAYDGYNVYVAGPEGLGKTTYVMELLQTLCKNRPIPPDWCYVHNFLNPQSPVALSLPPGKGKELQQEMELLIENLKREVPRAFESKDFEEKLQEVTERGRKEKEELMARLASLAEEKGFSVKFSPAGVVVVPLIGGKLVSEEEILKNNYLRELVEVRRREFEPLLKEYLRKLRQVDKEIQSRVAQLREEVARFVVGHNMEDMLEKYRDLPRVREYLEAVKGDLVKGADLFLQFPAAQDNPLLLLQLERNLAKYKVNVVVDNGGLTCAPVVYETHPTYTNLFGRIGVRAELGVYVADFQQIVPGSIHRANGGYLVLKVPELFAGPGVWRALKRALVHKEIAIQPLMDELGLPHPVTTLRPEAIPLDVKVVLIGERLHYHLLMALDPEFEELFKVKADFDTQVDNTPEVRQAYRRLLDGLVERDRLLPLTPSGAAAMLEYTCRLAQDRKKLSLQMSRVVGMLREANYWARSRGREGIEAQDVERALEEKIYRANLLEERLRELIQRNIIVVQTQGYEVGQCNGLSVVDLVDYSFGRPHRISARAFAGEKGIVNIEREAELAGKIFNKAVLILSGYLGHQYGRGRSLSLSATLAFEQSYSTVEGDSASVAELMALLSAIAQVPLTQDLAVTGSVDQRGMVQAVGGINEKIEGFFHCCRVKGLTGRQGVVFPGANVDHLQLSPHVVKAVERGEFHLYPVTHVDQVISLLTGMEAGERDQEGRFPPDSFHAAVEARLEEFRRAAREEKEGKGEQGGD